jgi:hypothetical protein
MLFVAAAAAVQRRRQAAAKALIAFLTARGEIVCSYASSATQTIAAGARTFGTASTDILVHAPLPLPVVLQVIVYKMKSKKHYRKTNGHRQPLSKILITKIA